MSFPRRREQGKVAIHTQLTGVFVVDDNIIIFNNRIQQACPLTPTRE
ncbi:MAG: hypothetical protein FWF23_03715 [Alphaproteobacteria bacterium]|nr:hypothetical protein [Alphaproteobacteria bacterium]